MVWGPWGSGQKVGQLVLLTAAVLFSTNIAFAFKTFVKPEPTVLEKFPPDAQEMLKRLPGERITLGLIIGAGLKYSDSFAAIASQKANVPVAQLKSQGVLDPILTVSGQYTSDKSEPLIPFSSSSQVQKGIKLGVQKTWATGTTLVSELQHGSADFEFASSSIPPLGEQFDSRLTFQIRQSLWQNQFGRQIRQGLKAGELNSEAVEAALVEMSQGWFAQLAKIYYAVWMAQSQVRMTNGSVTRRKRLKQITQVKLRRGTAERPDLLQVESAQINTEIAAEQAAKNLKDVWRNLVVSLKFPEAWLNIDPQTIPVALDEPVSEASSLCTGSPQGESMAEKNFEIQKLALQSQAADLNQQSAADRMRPQLNLSLSMGANGVESQAGESLSEATQWKNPQLAVGVELSMPLGRKSEKADLLQATASKEQLAKQLGQQRSDFIVSWQNSCLELERQSKEVEKRHEVFEKQRLRARLEQSRFRIGRSSSLNVIQAEDEADQAEIAWLQAEVEVRQQAWEIRQLAGQVKTYMEELASRPVFVE